MAKKDYSYEALAQADVNQQLSQQQTRPEPIEQVQAQPQQPTYRANIRGSSTTPTAGGNDFILPESEISNPLPAIEDWDYKTATSDRQGKVPLSYKLGDWEVKPQGFDANGDLYFGQGLNGWFKKLAYQTLDIAWGEEIQATEQKKIISDGFKKIQDIDFSIKLKNPLDEEANQQLEQESKEEAQNFASGVWDVIKGTWGLAGSKGSALEVPVKGVNLAAKTVIDVFQLVADTTEQVLGMNKTMRRYADEQGSQMPDVLEANFDPIKIGQDYAIQDELVNTFLRNINPVLNSYDAIRFWTAPGTFKQKTEALKTGWYESRMLYTELVKPSVEQEFLRRVQAGENPDLLAIEMQDPYAELVGELIFDPLNLVAGTAKANKFKNMVETAQDIGGVSDEITDILKIGSQGTTEAQFSASLDQAVDKIIDFGYRKVDDGSTVQKVIGKLEYKANSLNVRGMVTQKSKAMSEFTTWVAGGVKSKGGTPDDVLDTLGALVKMTSDKADEVKAGLSYINSSKMVSHPMAFFGQQALETGHMIRNLMGKGDNVEKFLTKIKTASWDDQAKLIDELLSNSAKNAYPTIAEMSVASNKIGSLDEVTTKLNRIQDLENRIKTASKTEIKNIKNEIATLKTGLPSNKEIGLAKEYARIAKERPSLVTLAKFDNEVSKVWRSVNSVFSNIYFTQYGFAARQWISNSFMVFKEGGVNAFFRDGGFKTMTHIEQELAQAFPAGLPAALNPKSIIDSVEVADNFITTAFKNFKGWKYSPQAFAEATERGAGLRVFYKYYRDTMDNMMDFGKGLPKLEEWTAKGFTAEMANDYKTILRSNGYNPTKAKEIFTQQYKNGTELFRDLGWVSDDVQKGLKDYGGWDELVNFVKNPETKTTEQITSFIEDMIDDVGRRANQTIYNPNAVSKERATDYIEQFGGNQKEIVGYRELQTHVSNAETAAMDAFRSDFTNASASARKTVQELIDRASQGGKLTPDETTQLSQLNEWLRKADLHMSKSEEIYTQNGERLKQLKKELDTWLGENKQYRYGDAPREQKWQDWYKAVEKTREDYFNFYNGGGAKLQEDYAMVMGIEPTTTFARSRKATVEVQRAKQIISGRNGGIFHTPPKGFGYSKVGESGHDLNVKKLAEYFGVPTQKQALLNTINKYSDKKFTSIFDVSLEDAQKALQQKTGIDADFVARLKREANTTFDTTYKSGEMTIEKAKNLSPEQSVVEAKFAEQILSNPQEAASNYWKARTGSEKNVLNVDYARELSPEYMANKATMAPAVQKPSSALIRKIADEKMAEPLVGLNPKNNRVVFTAGGPGSGKGTSLKGAGVDLTDAHLVWDMTMSDLKDLKYIDQAISKGRPVDVIYVARDPLDSLVGLAERAKTEGRTVPLSVWAEAHAGTPDVIREAIKKYTDNDLVNIRIIDNTGSFKDVKEVPLDFVKNRSYTKDDLIRQGEEALKKGNENGTISDEIYNAIVGDVRPRTGNVPENTLTKGVQEGGGAVAQGSGGQGLAGDIARTETKAGSVVDDTRGLIPASPIHPGGTAGFNDANAWAEGKEGLTKALKHIEQGLLERVGRRGLDVLDDAKSFDLDEIQKLVISRAEEAKLTATKVGSAYRDFALLPYGETTNLDHAMQFVFPYHFWYTRTYQNFAKSLVTNADMIAGYGKFKDFMATKYKEQPEWYKYNVKFPDFFGTNNGNPYMFNLESAIWPLQGITGTDFNNPQKRANWFTATLDDLGKFGPSTWTPISMAVAAYYKIKGDDELSAAWGTRAIPQTALVKAISSYFGNPIELDPNVHLFQGGLDPYEEGRVSRALASMENEGIYTPEQLLESARTHSGEAWDEAYIRATQQRAPGQILSSLFGVAFRPRTEDDIQTDNFYQDYNRMRNLHDSGLMSDEQYKQGFNQLREQYPFMDIILLSRRAGVGREEAYVYNVISRIPPGMSKEVYEKIGIDPETAQKFFDSGGKLEGMSETERARFIASFVDAGTMLAIPSNATRREWTSAKNMYGEMQKALKLEYGDDILDEIELYFNIDDVDKARLFLKTHPEVELALDDQQSYIVNNPQLMKFYGGLDTLDRFYSSSMYDELEKQFGENIVDLETQYFDVFDKADRTAFLKQNPQLKKYWAEKSRLKEENSRKVVEFGQNYLPAEIELTDAIPENPTQEALQELAPQPQISFQQWSQVIGEPMAELIQDYWYNDQDLPNAVESNLDYMASQYGYNSGDDLLQAILISMPQGQP